MILAFFFKFHESFEETKDYGFKSKREISIFGCMATIPSRTKHLDKVIDSLKKQVDHLFIYCNYGKNDKLPLCLDQDWITVGLGWKTGDYNDSSKFYFVPNLKGYIFTVDDDIIYHKNYVSDMINKLKKYNNKVVVTYHGGILPKNVTNYTKERNLIHLNGLNNEDKFVNICGTGVTAFHSNLLPCLSLDVFKTGYRSDLWFSLFLQKNNIPIVCIKHDKLLFVQIKYKYNLWSSEINFEKFKTKNTEIANQIEWKVFEV